MANNKSEAVMVLRDSIARSILKLRDMYCVAPDLTEERAEERANNIVGPLCELVDAAIEAKGEQWFIDWMNELDAAHKTA